MKGDNIGPELDGIMARRNERFMQRKLRNPRFNNSTTVMPEFALSEAGLEAIVANPRSVDE